MITSALLRTETERWREEVTISPPAWSYRRVPWQAWHDTHFLIVILCILCILCIHTIMPSDVELSDCS